MHRLRSCGSQERELNDERKLSSSSGAGKSLSMSARQRRHHGTDAAPSSSPSGPASMTIQSRPHRAVSAHLGPTIDCPLVPNYFRPARGAPSITGAEMCRHATRLHGVARSLAGTHSVA